MQPETALPPRCSIIVLLGPSGRGRGQCTQRNGDKRRKEEYHNVFTIFFGSLARGRYKQTQSCYNLSRIHLRSDRYMHTDAAFFPATLPLPPGFLLQLNCMHESSWSKVPLEWTRRFSFWQIGYDFFHHLSFLSSY